MWVKHTSEEWQHIISLLRQSQNAYVKALAGYLEELFRQGLSPDEVFLSEGAAMAIEGFISGYFLAKEEEGRKN